MELTDSLKTLLIETAKSRKGSTRRFFMARTVKELGPGGQPRVARERRWGRRTMCKGRPELDSGVPCVDAFALRGRKRAAEHLPNLLTDIHAIVDSQSQAAPQFRTTRLTAAADRRNHQPHMECSGLLPEESRAESAAKKHPETDAICAQLAAVNRAADAAETVLRLSMEAKAPVTVGPFARGGNIPQVMAALRNTAMGLMHWAGHTNMAAACRRFAAQPRAALRLIGMTLEN